MTTTTDQTPARNGLRIAREKLDQVLALGRERDEEARRIGAELEAKYPTPPGLLPCHSLGSPYWQDLEAAPCPAEDALRTFLEGLEAEEVREVEAVMYSGREGWTLDEMRAYLLRYTCTAKRVCISTITEKAPMVRHIEVGLRRLEGRRVRRPGTRAT